MLRGRLLQRRGRLTPLGQASYPDVHLPVCLLHLVHTLLETDTCQRAFTDLSSKAVPPPAHPRKCYKPTCLFPHSCCVEPPAHPINPLSKVYFELSHLFTVGQFTFPLCLSLIRPPHPSTRRASLNEVGSGDSPASDALVGSPPAFLHLPASARLCPPSVCLPSPPGPYSGHAGD